MLMLLWTILTVSYLTISGFALKENLRLKRIDKTLGIPWYQCFSPVKWYSVFYGLVMKRLVPPHVLEQLVIRFYDDYCRPNCLQNTTPGLTGCCDKCGCDAAAKMMSPQETCSRGYWGKLILNEKDYKKHRDKYPIKISIKYGQDV